MNASTETKELAISTNAADLRGELAPLYTRYKGQTEEQPASITLMCADYRAVADYSGEIGNATTSDVFHERHLVFGIPANVKGDKLADFLESDEFQSLAERICDGFDTRWNGNNHVGDFTDDAEAAREELETVVENQFSESDQTQVWSVADWCGAITYVKADKVSLDDFGTIIKKTTDDELADMAAKIEAEAESNGIYLEDDVTEWLESLRDDLPEEDEDEDEDE